MTDKMVTSAFMSGIKLAIKMMEKENDKELVLKVLKSTVNEMEAEMNGGVK